MASFPTRPEAVVIGAGAAGIAAARELRMQRISCLVLEARQRIGGRAWTASIGGEKLDLGCEWMHSADRNVLVDLAAGQGLTLNKSLPPWRKRTPQAGFDLDEQSAFNLDLDAFDARLDAAAMAAAKTGHDQAASDLLDRHSPWAGFIDAISTYYSGAPLDRVSIIDLDRYVDTQVNWRVDGGYGALIAALGDELPIKLGCAVTAVDSTGRNILVSTQAGTIETDAVIVTLPTNILASGGISFSPALDQHVEAATGLPLGLADKLFFRFVGAEDIAPDTRLIGDPRQRDTGSYTIRPGGRSLLEGYFGGDYARHLEKGGLEAFTDAARNEIGAALGADLGHRLIPLVATSWAEDPFSQGSYSHALPGRADDREKLATPVEGRIFFAGEATSSMFYSTAHGAFEEGQRAARALVAMRSDALRS